MVMNAENVFLSTHAVRGLESQNIAEGLLNLRHLFLRQRSHTTNQFVVIKAGQSLHIDR